MKKALFTMMCLFAMMAAGSGLKAQEITITLDPGWNWIGYPNAEPMAIASALGDFVPMEGDMIYSQDAATKYQNGVWRGRLGQFIPGKGYHYYSNRTEEVSFVFASTAPQVTVTTSEPTDITATSAVVGGTVDAPEGTHVFQYGVCWGTEPSPDIDGNHTSDGTGMGSFSSTLEGLTTGLTYYVRAYVVTDNGLAYGNEVSFTTLGGGSGNDHEYVDLGLPSGTLWATCNVGADNPEEYGDYFAWGETQPKDFYDWSTYQYYIGALLTKYCTDSYSGYQGFTDNLTTLLPEDDAATANWGGDWRMPTKEEWQELYYNTTKTMTTQNGVNGLLFTANNGNSIFLPAAGFREESGVSGINGRYWSSMLDINYIYCLNSCGFGFTSDGFSISSYDRDCGQSVRAVRCKNSVINVSANLIEGGSVSGGGTYMDHTSCTITAMANEGFRFIYWTENGDFVSNKASYSFIVNGNRNLVANFAAPDSSSHDYVDLGLPSGTLWATCNVGADTPEDYGDYFAWGETAPKINYNWSTYLYCNGTTLNEWGYIGPLLTKYCYDSSYGYNGFTDNLTTLLPEDDAATANWGADWRMPTDEEFQELYDNTTCTWTTQNGVNGRLFTAENGNSLFLPAAGLLNNVQFSGAGSEGTYWSSSLYTDYPNFETYPNNASFFYFNSDNTFVFYNYRYYGISVRPVFVSGNSGQSYTINVSASPSNGGSVSGGGSFYGGICTVTATPNAFYSFLNWTENGNVVSTNASYTFTVTANRTLVANFIESDGNGHGYVDLGLPSGTLWAACNVGANSPEDYGDYFAWGETQLKDVYNWSTYQYCNGSENTLTKYCNNSSYGYNGFTDNLTILLPEDDAATVNWGDGWRMPTKEEWQELYNNTTCIWTTQIGVDGLLFTSSNGNSLFLPAAGFRGNSYLYDADSRGLYLSSSLGTDYPSDAWVTYFDSSKYGVGCNYRYHGLSVRAVRSASQN